MPAPGNFRNSVPRTAATKAVNRATHRGAVKTKITVVTRGGKKIFVKADAATNARATIARDPRDGARAKPRDARRPGRQGDSRAAPEELVRAKPARGVKAAASHEPRDQSRGRARPDARPAPRLDAGAATRPDPAARAPRRPDPRPATVAATPNAIRIQLTGEYIELNQLLKLAGLATSGGGGKAMVAAGGVRVDGKEELRKTSKIRAGQVVKAGDTRIRVIAAKPGADADPASAVASGATSLPEAAPDPAAAEPPAAVPRRARAAKAARAARKLAPE